MAEPTAYEQYMLELLNRARANPDDEASRLNGVVIDTIAYNGDLNEGLTPGTISSSAKQPLAFNLNLIDAAKNQSDWMLTQDMATYSDPHNRIPIGQTDPVNTPAQRMAAAGYANLNTFVSRENLARSLGSSPFDLTTTTENQHNALFIDEGVAGRGHRISMMDEDSHEIGISIVSGGPITEGGESFPFSVVSTQNFAFITNANPPSTSTDSFLTGVAFRDTDDNDFYTPGEGLGDVTININGVTNPAFMQSIQTMAAGGYQIQLAVGDYSVEFLRDGSVVQTQTVTIGSENVKVDLFQEVGTNPSPGTGKIVGNKFNDANSNGVWDSGESGLAGWTIYLDANGNRQLDSGETSTTTDANGEYIFNNLTPGTYNVAEVLQSGWTQTLPDPSNPIGFEAYQLDNGQINGAAGLSNDSVPFVALNSFSVQTGLETIDSITVALGSANPSKVLLYSDPNGDGNPNDAVKLTEVDTTLTGISGFASVALPNPVSVSGNFFVGALYGAGASVPVDTNTTDLDRSLYAVDLSNENNFDDLSNEFSLSAPGNFLLRANSPGVLPNVVTVAANQTVANVNFGNECFLTGTRILTEQGEIAVENLKIGDKVKTAEGKLEPVKWIGKQTCHPHQVINPLRSYPILIKAGALGNNLPHRNLYVSPDHAMFFEGLLINAGALVNDISIIKTEPTETFCYYHIELENHALLLAEGASAESYLPQKENREDYDNGAEYEELYPHGSNLMLWPMDYPRVSSKNKVPRYIRKKLDSIAVQLANKVIKLGA